MKILDWLFKARGKKDITKLQKKVVVDKRGHQRTVYVKILDEKPGRKHAGAGVSDEKYAEYQGIIDRAITGGIPQSTIRAAIVKHTNMTDLQKTNLMLHLDRKTPEYEIIHPAQPKILLLPVPQSAPEPEPEPERPQKYIPSRLLMEYIDQKDIENLRSGIASAYRRISINQDRKAFLGKNSPERRERDDNIKNAEDEIKYIENAIRKIENKTEPPAEKITITQPDIDAAKDNYSSDNETKFIPLGKISAEKQIRQEFDPVELRKLADSISESGLLQAIVVQPSKKNPGEYTIIAGERRFRALKLLESEGRLPSGTVKASVRTVTDREKKIMQLAENYVRQDNTPLEISDFMVSLVNDEKMSVKDLAKQTGETEAKIRAYLKIGNLSPNLRKIMEQGGIKMTAASMIGGLEKHSDQERAYAEMVRNNLTAPQLQQWISGFKNQQTFFTDDQLQTDQQKRARQKLGNTDMDAQLGKLNKFIEKQQEFVSKFIQADGKLSGLAATAAGNFPQVKRQVEQMQRDLQMLMNRLAEAHEDTKQAGLFMAEDQRQAAELMFSEFNDLQSEYNLLLAFGHKDIAKLQKKVITNKRGRQQTVYVQAGGEKPEQKTGKKQGMTRREPSPIIERAELVPGNGPWIAHAEGMPKQTIDRYFTGHPDEGGQPKPERQRLIANIVAEHFKNAKSVPADKQPVAILMMGGPASGKSSMVKAAGSVGGDYVVADADGVKEMLPEYRAAVKSRARDAAAMAHEESSYIVKKIRQQAIDSRMNVVIDGTGSKISSYLSNIETLKKRGYRVKLMFADCDPNIAIERARGRSEKTGRWVPPEFIGKAYSDIPGNFAKVAKLVDDFSIYDTQGFPPKIVASGGNGDINIHDNDWHKNFQKKGGNTIMKAEQKPRITNTTIDLDELERKMIQGIHDDYKKMEEAKPQFAPDQGIIEVPYELKD